MGGFWSRWLFASQAIFAQKDEFNVRNLLHAIYTANKNVNQRGIVQVRLMAKTKAVYIPFHSIRSFVRSFVPLPGVYSFNSPLLVVS